jgi:hypothetical protein
MIDQTDTIIKDLLDDMHARLKNARGPKQHGYHDGTKPSLDYSAGEPLKIKKSQPQRIRIASPK